MESDFFKNIKFTIENDSNETYHSHRDYIGASGLKQLKKSPAHYFNSLVEKKEPTDAMIFGSGYHTYCLEEEKFNSEYYILDEYAILEILISEGFKSPRSTKKYKEWLFNEETKAAGKIMFNIETFDSIKRMAAKIRKHRYCNTLLSTGIAEMSIYAELTLFDGSDIKIKIRPDKFIENKRICTDLKSTADASINGFPRHAAELDYHIQAALYSDILDLIFGKGMGIKFFFIAQEKSAPYAFNIFEASPQFIAQGRYEYEQLILLYQQCLKDNFYPGYQVWCENIFGIHELNLPPYQIHEINYYNHKF